MSVLRMAMVKKLACQRMCTTSNLETTSTAIMMKSLPLFLMQNPSKYLVRVKPKVSWKNILNTQVLKARWLTDRSQRKFGIIWRHKVHYEKGVLGHAWIRYGNTGPRLQHSPPSFSPPLISG